MAGVRAILDRLRPAGAPGTATTAGVPADHLDSLGRELAPVFEHLAPVRSECARLIEEATAAAREREAEAARQARDLVARAETEGEAERAAATAAARSTAADEAERSLTEARSQAQAVRQRGEQRRARLLARVLDVVRADLRALASDEPVPAGQAVTEGGAGS